MRDFGDLELPDCLEQWEDGSIHVAGHRVTLYHIIDHLKTSGDPTGLEDRFPTIPVAKLAIVASYCDQHWDAMLQLHSEIRAAAEKLRMSNKCAGLSREELLRRMRSKRAQIRPEK
jgi:hypothetical protein